MGTLDYAAPEQIEGRALDGRTDQYALGCAAFELLAAEPPFRREEGLAVMYAQLSAPPPKLTGLRAELPPAVDQVLGSALAKPPAGRYASCGEFADALRTALGLPAYNDHDNRAPRRTATVLASPGPAAVRAPPMTAGHIGLAAVCGAAAGWVGLHSAASDWLAPAGLAHHPRRHHRRSRRGHGRPRAQALKEHPVAALSKAAAAVAAAALVVTLAACGGTHADAHAKSNTSAAAGAPCRAVSRHCRSSARLKPTCSRAPGLRPPAPT